MPESVAEKPGKVYNWCVEVPVTLRYQRILCLAVVVWSMASGVLPANAESRRAALDQGRAALLTGDGAIYLEALPQRGEGLLGFSRRLCGTSRHAAEIGAANNETQRLLSGVRYRVPFRLLQPEQQLATLRALFKADYPVASGWYHEVTAVPGVGAESLWAVAEWFTGRGDNYRAIRDYNALADDELQPGQLLLVPARLLRPSLRSALPPDSPYYLEYGEDEEGEYAVYRLKPGEALYSSVVIRFTGQIYAEDVNALASEIAARSGIGDVTGIPVGYRVKVPYDLLLPEFLPASAPRRQEYEAGLLASSQYSNRVTASRLRGITVILDAGHGGSDVGANVDGVWESVYVYDVMARIKRVLEQMTAATVLTTVRAGSDYEIAGRDVLAQSRDHRVLTTPSYTIEESRVGLHLRWYLSNSLFRQALKRDNDPEKVVFLSIHADSLHPSLRGTMIYVPGAQYRQGSFGVTGPVYAARREYREKPKVSYSDRERVKSEGLSRQLAESIVRSVTAADLPVHSDKPIRERIIRKRRAWVPAVLRYNAVPAQGLVEVCNLANDEDRKLIQTQRYRQRIAEAVAVAIIEYYGASVGKEELEVASLGTR